MAVQRRRPGVPRRSFGISLTPPLIISLFLPASFVAESGNAPYKPARRSLLSRFSVRFSSSWPPKIRPYKPASVRKCTQMRVHTDTHARARVSAYTRPCLAARKRKGRRKRRRTGEVACKFASGITSAEMQKLLRDRLVGQIRKPHLPPRDRRIDERAIRERYGIIRLFFL